MKPPRFINAHRRGLWVTYRPGERNWCPGCGREHWHVGTLQAECAFCSTALPIADAPARAVSIKARGRDGIWRPARWRHA